MPPELTVRLLTKTDWPVITRLFGARGACGGCWCMWWHVPRGGKYWEEVKGDKNRRSFMGMVKAGKIHGVLAFAGDEPVGWCQFGPRDSFARMAGARSLQRETGPDTWSVVCFYIAAGWRGQGVASGLLEAATRRAFALGAAEVEGFPKTPSKAGERMPAAFAWTGVPALYRKAGFKKLRRAEGQPPIYIRKSGA